MKLYWSPGACSQAPHILLHEVGLDHTAVRVDLKAKKLEDGSDYLAVNPKGAVPALQLDSGEVLTENAVILQYIGDRTNWPEVFPPLGDFRRYRVLELVNFITTELHKRFSFLFSNAGDETKNFVKEQLAKKLDWIDEFVTTEIEALDLAFPPHTVHARAHPVHPEAVRPLQAERRRRILAQHLLDEARVPRVVLDEQDRLGRGLRADHRVGSVAIVSQKRSMDWITVMNFSRSTGFVT